MIDGYQVAALDTGGTVKVAVFIIAALTSAALGLSVALALQLGSANTQIGQLQTQVSGLSGELRGVDAPLNVQRALSSDQQSITSLNTSLNTSTDPLSAYNEICSSQQVNNTTGVTQTYYYPCTNQVQTIPQPGS
jgi:hypothetical protein